MHTDFVMNMPQQITTKLLVNQVLEWHIYLSSRVKKK